MRTGWWGRSCKGHLSVCKVYNTPFFIFCGFFASYLQLVRSSLQFCQHWSLLSSTIFTVSVCVHIHIHTLRSHTIHRCTRTDQRRKNTTKLFNSTAAKYLSVLLDASPETPAPRYSDGHGVQENSSQLWVPPQFGFRVCEQEKKPWQL